MKKALLIMILIAVVSITGIAMAIDPSEISNISTPEWAIAGGTAVNIRVTVTNATLKNDYSNTTVTLKVINPAMGSIISEKKVLSANGVVDFPFIPNKTKGIADIELNVTYSGSFQASFERIYLQKIDHAGPKYIIDASSPSPIPVNTTIDIKVRFRDNYGNILDANNKREDFIVRFDTTGNDGYFISSSGPRFNLNITTVPNPLPNGIEEATVQYHFPTKAGKNIIMVSALDTTDVIPASTFFVIDGVGTTPYHIDLALEDNDDKTLQFNKTYADPKHYFKFIYTVRDVYGNPIPNVPLEWSTSAGDSGTYNTNYAGNVYLEYSKDTPQVIVVTATVTATVDGATVSVSRDDSVEFIQTEAVDFRLSANPQIMPSRDVKGKENETALITVKVFDFFGQPKANQKVYFSIDYGTLENSTYLMLYPVLFDGKSDIGGGVQVERITDENGLAAILFRPGAFPTDWNDPGYNITATGSVNVYATWEGRSLPIEMVYKNYPFVKVISSVQTGVCIVNDTLNYSLSIVGDGYVMNYPVDVLLLENRAGTMLQERDTSAHLDEDRMWHVQDASKVFIGELDEGKDRIAIASYGDLALPTADLTNHTGQYGQKMRDQEYLTGVDNDKKSNLTRYWGNNVVHYDDFSTIDRGFTSTYTTLNQTIMEITPIDSYNKLRDNPTLYSDLCVGDQNTANSLRYGLYKSITYLRQTDPNAAKIRVIVGLMDDEWTWFGDPTAQGSLMQKPCGANAGTGPYWPFVDPDKWPNSPMVNWQSEPSKFTGDWNFADGKNNWQNMSKYALDNDIVLFMIRYSAHQDTETERTLNYLCSPTGGEAVYASTPKELIDAFIYIGKKIHQLASVNTTTTLDFTTINVSYAELGTQEIEGWKVLNYSYNADNPPYSTHILKKNSTSTIFDYMQNDTANWTANHTFNWDVGDMNLNDNWTVTFRMNVLVPGNINLFGPKSQISADNPDDDLPAQNLTLPETWVSCFQNWTVPLTSQEVIDVKDTVAYYNDSPDILNVTWNLTYTKNLNEKGKIIKQELFYQVSQFPDVWTNNWIKFGTLEHNATVENVNRTFTYPLSTPEKQGYIKIQIFAYENFIGGAYDREYTNTTIPILRGSIIIR